MAIKLNEEALSYAEKLIDGKLEVEHGKKWNWQEHRPTPDESAKFLNTHYLRTEYGLWFLGIDTEKPDTSKEHYVYPYGDLKIVHREALVAARDKANKDGHHEIARAAEKLLKLIDAQG
ncbi:MAG TPA: hypothetical protein VHA52_05250 [Candidatus Babeliaceae bacterium]|nr:hypothetical protein [Candidatus Babeliaceae bacterium]